MASVSQLEMVGRLVLAAFLGFLIGLEREFADQPAGERTHALASLGAAVFALVSVMAFPGSDPARVAAGVVTGLGFLGAGMILKGTGRGVQGLTTAAGIWTVGGIGLAIGAGLYLLGVTAAVLVGLVLTLERLLKIDERLERRRRERRD
ncbi:MAG: MgtC/SapB family protein [Chloroflexi bacterium]|nr:MgtC/SapB family protein [Chloroflexota bacterium]